MELREMKAFSIVLMRILQELQRQGSADIVIGLAGNKLDLSSQRKVDAKDAKAYADENGCIFFETSAKTGANVQEIFVAIAQKLPKNVEPQQSDTIQIISTNESQGTGCCGGKK